MPKPIQSTQFLTFKLGEEVFAIEIAPIREILEYPRITTIPLTPEFVRGVMNVRGNVVPVIDLALRLGHQRTEIARRTCVVIVEVAHCRRAAGVCISACSSTRSMKCSISSANKSNQSRLSGWAFAPSSSPRCCAAPRASLSFWNRTRSCPAPSWARSSTLAPPTNWQPQRPPEMDEVSAMTISTAFHPSLLAEGVLVVEDSVVQREAAIAQLRKLGISRTWAAADGQLALQLLQTPEVNPAVVCVDLVMPGMDGIEFLQNLQLMDRHPLVIVVSSAKSAILNSVGLMVEALGLPLLGVIQKPLTAEQLQRTLLRAAEVGAAPAIDRRPPPPSMAPEDLLEALASRRVVPYYQPKVSLKTGEIVGFEALARCLTRTGEVLSPAAFIDVAEEHGQMDTLTLRMLDCVLRDLALWHANNLFPTVSLNVSASSLVNRLFGQELMQRVDAAQISPTALTLEITESALITDLASAIAMLGRMRLKGFGLSLDDYGTGFSSLQQLDRLPFTELKIDRSFVAQVDRKESRRRILASAVRIGEQLELTTVAEGVETAEELNTLRKLGCLQVQGYLIAKPMPFNQVLPWLGAQRDRVKRPRRTEY